jgi:hypothetical protein
MNTPCTQPDESDRGGSSAREEEEGGSGAANTANADTQLEVPNHHPNPATLVSTMRV